MKAIEWAIAFDSFCTHYWQCFYRHLSIFCTFEIDNFFVCYCYWWFVHTLQQLLTLYVLQYYAQFKLPNWHLFNALSQLKYFVSTIALDNFSLHLTTFACIFYNWQLFMNSWNQRRYCSNIAIDNIRWNITGSRTIFVVFMHILRIWHC